MHLNRALMDPEPLRLICKEKRFAKSHRMPIFAADFSKLESFPDTIQRLHHPLKVTEWTKSTIIGSCNGLLCSNLVCYKDFDDVYRYDESFLIFNPLTRKCQWISGDFSSDETARSNLYGFGYDDFHDDYKVVTLDIRPSEPEDFSGLMFEVYSVRNGEWSATFSELDSSSVNDFSSGVLVNCVLHWMWKIWTDSSHCGHCEYEIVAFDLRTEEHWSMETPHNDLAIPGIDDMNEYYCRMDLGVLNGCLCGIVYDGDVPNKLDLWVMKVYGVEDSWVKMTIDMSSQVQITGEFYTKLVTPIVPIEHAEKKEQMMLYSYEEGVLLCDMVTNKLSKVIKFPEFGPKWRQEMISKFSYARKEFCFQGSLVELPAFCSFDSFDKKRRRMQRKAKRRKMQDSWSNARFMVK